MSIIKSTTFLIIGGGIAGISCIETLQYQIESSKNKIEINQQQQQHEQPQPQQQQIILLTESPLIKSVTNLVPLGKALTRFDIEEKCAKNKFHNSITVEIIIDQLDEINTELKYAITKASGTKINYQLLCLCTGARPKLIESIPDDCRSFVLGIRDTESVRQLQKRIQSNSRRIAIIGNGGIASEIVYELKNIEIMWIIKDRFISQTFIDPGAAEFFQNKLNENGGEGKTTSKEIAVNSQSIIKRMRYLEEETETEDSESVKLLTKNGAALGPDWHRLINFNPSSSSSSSSNDRKTTEKFIKIYNNCEIKSMKLNENYQRLNSNSNSNSDHTENNFPLIIELTNLENEKIYCDFLISATGVQPTINFKLSKFKSAFAISPTDGGILIDKWMRTSIPNIFAAGDVCTANWMKSEHWFQMRLWTQARQMGSMAGKSMWAVYQQQIHHDSESESELELKLEQDFSFELFGHVTQLYGYQVVLLGKFNGQGLMMKMMMSNDVATDEDCQDCEIILRMTANKEYIKYILVGGKLKGAILIGDTGLEETTENLILNQLDLRAYGDDILNPDIDIEDYFD